MSGVITTLKSPKGEASNAGTGGFTVTSDRKSTNTAQIVFDIHFEDLNEYIGALKELYKFVRHNHPGIFEQSLKAFFEEEGITTIQTPEGTIHLPRKKEGDS